MNRKHRGEDTTVRQKPRLFDSSIVGTAQEAVDFITNTLESSTEYSVIAKDLTGNILLWNEGARGKAVTECNCLGLTQPASTSGGLTTTNWPQATGNGANT